MGFMDRKLFHKVIAVVLGIAIGTFILSKTSSSDIYNRAGTEWNSQRLYEISHISESEVKNLPQNDTFSMDNANQLRLIYNRVPKCGSTSMLSVISALQKKNHFYHNREREYTISFFSEKEQRKRQKEIYKLRMPSLYTKHMYFINFKKYVKKMPIYINLIRDPFDRMVSHFYYTRSPIRKKFREYDNVTLEECVVKNYRECQDHEAILVRFFCGHDKICRDGGPAALAQAKRNIVQYHAVVGITEQLNDFLVLLEDMIPLYFDGASQFVSTNKERANTYKSPVSPELKKIMIEKLTQEYDLYHFVRQRFNTQLYS